MREVEYSNDKDRRNGVILYHGASSEALPSREIVPGARATWMYEARGGYGYVIPVPVTVLRVSRRRVLVRVPLRSGGYTERWVTPGALRLEELGGQSHNQDE
ncbi:MAG: hypothetical protein ACM3US_07345 [Sphingomonadaceae bacterium]